MARHVFDTIRAAADPEKAQSMCAYMRSQFVFLGVPTPIRRRLSRSALKEMGQLAVDWDFVGQCWQQPEREFQYLALDYLAARKAILAASDIANLRQLAVTKPWWDTIDVLDTIIGAVALSFPEISQTLLAWSRDGNKWLRRVAIDHQRGRKEQTNTELLEQILVNNLEQTEFFINKAIGWSLREYSKTNPAWVSRFISQYRSQMAALSVREASKYL
jgi:3-methyladenine DNA glycosylase AlkD